MVPFDYNPRTRVIFGHGTLARLGNLARELGFRRTLVVADRGIVEAGHVHTALRLLEAAHIDADGFHEFEVNPDGGMAEAGRGRAESFHADSIVAIGGGSTINCAKALNLLLTNGGAVEDYRGYGKIATPLLPAIAIPTTAGTGAEAHGYIGLRPAGTEPTIVCADPSATPRAAILDPELATTAPHHVTAMSGFDAIAHTVETAVTTKRTAVSDVFSHQGWRLLNDAFERVLLHPADPDARATMSIGAHFGGTAIDQSMLGAAHACAGALTARYNLSHGLALAIVLPHVVRWNAPVANDGYAALLGSPRRRARDEEPAEILAARLEDLAAAGGLAVTLADAGVPGDALPELARAAAKEWAASFNPRPFDPAGALEILRAASPA